MREEGVKNILIAYPFLAKKPSFLSELEGFDVFLDCGAWSVASGAIAPVSIAEYIAWVQPRATAFAVVTALDVLGDAAQTRINYNEMRMAGVECLPTWHVGEPRALAREYASTAEYMAIGGLASCARSGKTVEHIARAWPEVCDRRVHFFGVGTTKPLVAYRPYSADMAGWLVGAIYGEVYSLVQWPIIRNFDVTVRSGGFCKKAVMARIGEFAQFGMTWRELATSREARLRYNVRVLLEFERRINVLPRALRGVA